MQACGYRCGSSLPSATEVQGPTGPHGAQMHPFVVKVAPLYAVNPGKCVSDLLMAVISEPWYEFPHLLALRSQTWRGWAGLCSFRELFTKFR